MVATRFGAIPEFCYAMVIRASSSWFPCSLTFVKLAGLLPLLLSTLSNCRPCFDRLCALLPKSFSCHRWPLMLLASRSVFGTFDHGAQHSRALKHFPASLPQLLLHDVWRSTGFRKIDRLHDVQHGPPDLLMQDFMQSFPVRVPERALQFATIIVIFLPHLTVRHESQTVISIRTSPKRGNRTCTATAWARFQTEGHDNDAP